MTTNYPAALDTVTQLKNDAGDGTTTSNVHAVHHNNVSDALIAIETEIGVNLKGGFADLTARLAGLVEKTHDEALTFRSVGDFSSLIIRQAPTQSAAPLLSALDVIEDEIITWDRTGLLNAAGYEIAGSPLASTHLSDTALFARNPSPALVSPTMLSPVMSGTPVSTTDSVDNNSTRIATTAWVKNQGYITINNPVFTGNPTAPTQSQGNDSTRIATTAFVVAEILANQTSPAPPGSIIGFSGTSAPEGWLICDGSSISRTTYADLFTAIGTSYGSADGNSFNLPDTRGRFAVGLGTHSDVNALSDNDGQGTVASRRPAHAHTHTITTTGSGTTQAHSGNLSGVGNHDHSGTGGASQGGIQAGGGVAPAVASGVSTSTDGSHSHSGGFGGGGHTHTVSGTVGTAGMTDTPGYLTLNYIIKT